MVLVMVLQSEAQGDCLVLQHADCNLHLLERFYREMILLLLTQAQVYCDGEGPTLKRTSFSKPSSQEKTVNVLANTFI